MRRSLAPRRWSLARQLLVLQVGLVVVAVAAACVLAYLDARGDSLRSAESRVTAVAVSVADSPQVVAALDSADPSTELQPYAERVRMDTGADFVVVMGPDRTRYSHPNEDLVGQPFLGTIAPALRGETFTETFTGTLGPSVRAVTPVHGAGDEVIGLVAVGVTLETVGADVRRALPGVLLAGLGILALAIGGAVLVARRLRRVTRGLGPEELARMYGYYDAVLHSVREGLVLVDAAGRLQLANDEARRLLALPAAVEGRSVEDAGLPPALAAALASGRELKDEIHLTRDRVVVVSSAPAVQEGRVLGRVVTLRDHTELEALTGELDTTRSLAEALRSQAHEAANRLHTVVSLIELGRPDDAIHFATDELRAAQQLTDRVVSGIGEPVVAAMLLGKSAVAAERGVDLVIGVGTTLDADALQGSDVTARDLVTVLGNLLDNAIDAAADAPAPRTVEVTVRAGADLLTLRVADSGPGMDASVREQAFRRGWSTKTVGAGRLHGRGLGLALVGQTVDRLAGRIEVDQSVGAVLTVVLPLREAVRR